MDREQRTDAHRTTPVRCSRTMQTDNTTTWIEAIEELAVRLEDAPLALAALSARRHSTVRRVVASVLGELARMSAERIDDVKRLDSMASSSISSEGGELAALLVRGWEALARLDAKGASR